MAGKKNTDSIVHFVSAVAVFIFVAVLLLQGWMFFRCFFAARAVPSYAAYPSVRVLFYGSGKGTVSARFSLYDTAGREFAVIDRSWSGDTLAVDFTTASFAGKTFVFPFKIRPSEQQSGGTNISHYYLDHGLCMLLGEPCTLQEKHSLYQLAVFALRMADRFSTRFSETRTMYLSECVMGNTYDILTNSDGLLILQPM